MGGWSYLSHGHSPGGRFWWMGGGGVGGCWYIPFSSKTHRCHPTSPFPGFTPLGRRAVSSSNVKSPIYKRPGKFQRKKNKEETHRPRVAASRGSFHATQRRPLSAIHPPTQSVPTKKKRKSRNQSFSFQLRRRRTPNKHTGWLWTYLFHSPPPSVRSPYRSHIKA